MSRIQTVVRAPVYFAIAALGCFALFSGTSVADNASRSEFPVEFSADLVITIGGSAKTIGSVYVSKENLRWDVYGDLRSSLILDIAHRQMWQVYWDQKTALNLSDNVAWDPQIANSILDTTNPYEAERPCAHLAQTSCERIGADAVDGVPCSVWSLTKTEGDKRSNSKICVSERLQFPVRQEDEKGIAELHHVQEKVQPSNLFEIPADFRKVGGGSDRGFLYQRE
jgi:hypothetical protein